MHTLAEIFDLARKKSGITSDNKLAAALDVPRAQISQWRHGTHVMQGHHAARLSALCGLSEEYVLVCILNAEAKRSDEERRVFRRIAARFRGAAIITLAISAGFIGASDDAYASVIQQNEQQGILW